MRTLTGAEHFAALRSSIATTLKHGLGTLDSLTMLTTGNPWLPETTRPVTLRGVLGRATSRKRQNR